MASINGVCSKVRTAEYHLVVSSNQFIMASMVTFSAQSEQLIAPVTGCHLFRNLLC